MELTTEQIQQLNKTHYLSITDDNEEKATDSLKSERRIIHYISTPALDRVADIMKPKGMDSTNFDMTKTVFANHNYDFIIGKNVKLLATNDGVKATTYFSKDTRANDIYNLHLEGVLNGWSIGFKPVFDKKGMIKEGSIEWEEGTNIRIFHEWELLEYSSTGIPANPQSIDIAKSICKSFEMKKEIEVIELKNLIDSLLLKDTENTKAIESLNNELENNKLTLKDFNSELTIIKNSLTKKTVENKIGLDTDLIKKIVNRKIDDLFYGLTGKKFNN